MNSQHDDGICFKDAQGRPRIVIQVHRDTGVPYLQLCDDRGLPRLELTLADDGSPCLRMFSEKGVQAFVVGVSESDSGAGMNFFSLDGSHGVTLSVSKDGVEFSKDGVDFHSS